MKIPSPRGGPHASRKRFPLSAPRTAPAGRAHALLARGLPLLLIALAALVLSSVGHAQDLDSVLVSNTGQTAGSDLATATGRVSYAQSFTTGDHPDGYFLSSVDVGLKADSGVTAEVALWWSQRGVFLNRIGYHFIPTLKLTTLSGVGSIDEDAATLERFSANDVLLLPGTTYWIVVTRTGGADDGLSVATTSSEAAVDAGGMAGFSVGNNVWVSDPDGRYGWDDYSGSVDASMKIGLRGSEATRPPGPYATNRNEKSRAAAAETSSSTSRYATSFTTASNPDTHQLTSVLLGVAAEAGVSPRVAIHADASGGRPAASAVANGTLTAPADVSRVLGAPDRAEFTTSPAISLAGGTTYWVVLDVGSGSGRLSVSTTASDDNDEIPRPQWAIGNRMKAYSGTLWSDDSEGRSFRMALNGPTDQYTGSPVQPLREVRIGLPQVGLGVAAEILDQSERIKNATWQWQRGETSDGTFTDIPAAQGGTSRVYVPVAADLGKWLKALATYENAFGPGKMVSGVSGQAVFSQPIMSNAGQTSDIGYVLQHPTLNIAQAFTTGGNPSGYSLSGLRFGINIDTDADALSWALYADAAGEPAAASLFTHITVPSASLDGVTRTFEDLVHPGFPLAPDTKYWAVLTSSPLMEGGENPTLGLAGISEWGENVVLDGPAAELDPGSESGWTLHFSALASPADPMSTEEWVPFAAELELEPNGKIVLRMSVLTYATEVEVFENWSLKPDAVVVGDKFRLLIVTSTALNASTTVMDSYNGIIRDSVAAGHTDIRPYSHLFNALGSTALVDAIDNTKTTHTTTDMGVPIYYLNGAKVADNYSDFYDGTWDSPDPTNELGTSSSAIAVWTGSQSNGMKHANPLGNRTSKTVRMGNPTSSVSGDVLSATLIRNHTFKDRSYLLPFYGLSPVFEVRALSAPDVPQDLTATQGVASVRLAWAAPKSDGGSPIIRYEYRHEAGTSAPSGTTWNSAGTAQSVTVTGLMGGTEYTFEVRAVNSNSIGNGEPATESARTVVTENTLVSNLAQPDSGSFVKIRHRPDTLPDGYITGPKRLAQNFTTGANTSGYTLDGIDIRAAVRTLAHHSQDLDFDVSLCPVKDQNQSPGAGCSELTRPETFDARSRLNFQAPADLTLAANTTYAVVLSGYGDIANTASDAEDTPATPGWSIGNSYHTFIIWSTDEPNNGYWHSNGYSLAIPFAIRAVAMSGQQAADPPTITAPPSVSESGADGQWTPGQTVQATVTFSEAVAVDTSGGTPTITLTPGATGQKNASYTSGGGTEALVFAYTLSEDDGTHTSMGVAPDSLALNGGSITSEATGVNADLSHNGTLIMGTTEDTSTSDDGSAAKDDGSAAKDDTEENEPAPNHPATGSPIIAGTVQVGETLSVDTSGISDADGIANSTPTYQWIANDGTNDTDIQDATGSTYILSAADEGKTVKVRVSFTDDEGNQETLTSAPTAAVAATVPGAPGSLSVSVNDTGKLDVSWSVPPTAMAVRPSPDTGSSGRRLPTVGTRRLTCPRQL